MNALYDKACLEKVKDWFIAHRATISVAESVTAGHLQAALSSAENAMQFFQGGITAYNAGQKTRHLNVEPIYALEKDCVSREVAIQMARGSNHLFVSDYAIAITGYASPQPREGITTLFAFVAVAKGEEVIRTEKITSAKKNPADVQVDYANQVLHMLAEGLKAQQDTGKTPHTKK